MLNAWQHLPEQINPVVFSVGELTVYWYALLYVGGLSSGLAVLLWRAHHARSAFQSDDIWNVTAYILAGVLIGGRLGYVFLYNPDFFLSDPWQIVWPVNPYTGTYTGLAGMSFHGSLLGAIVMLWWYAKRNKQLFWALADELALVAPLGLFLGRIGNFMNLELFGRVTTSSLGMYFPGAWSEGMLRYPSQLFEAFGEGVFLFFLVWRYGKGSFPGRRALVFLVGYGVIRFLLEYFREPDPQIGFISQISLTMGQILCLGMVFTGLLAWRILRRYAMISRSG